MRERERERSRAREMLSVVHVWTVLNPTMSGCPKKILEDEFTNRWRARRSCLPGTWGICGWGSDAARDGRCFLWQRSTFSHSPKGPQDWKDDLLAVKISLTNFFFLTAEFPKNFMLNSYFCWVLSMKSIFSWLSVVGSFPACSGSCDEGQGVELPVNPAKSCSQKRLGQCRSRQVRSATIVGLWSFFLVIFHAHFLGITCKYIRFRMFGSIHMLHHAPGPG